MSDEGDQDDQPVVGPLLPPEDRLWRHPSEVAGMQRSATAPDVAATASADRSFPWGLSLVSAVAGATAALGLLLIAGGLGSSTIERRGTDPGDEVAAISEVATISTVPAAARPGGVAELAEAFSPAVVRVELADGQVATGVLLDDEGTMLTTAHGLDQEPGASVPVVLNDGERVDATVVGTDGVTDLAVLRVRHDGAGARLGSSDLVAVGDPALVVAAPLGTSNRPTVTVAVVRALEDALAMGEHTVRGLIRADAGLVAEASGGALLDQRGALVGIVTLPPGQAQSGTGWAVPLELARQVVDDVLAHGRARHVWLGIEGTDAPGGGGVLVASVSPDSPAEDAGVQAQDRIVALAARPVSSMADLVDVLREHQPGDDVDVDVVRDQPETLVVTLGER